MTPRARIALALAFLALAGVGCGSTEPEAHGSGVANNDAVARSAGSAPFRFFAPDSIWNRRLADDEPRDPSSARVMAAFRAEISRQLRRGSGPNLNTVAYSVPIYTVPADQPTVQVTLIGGAGTSLQAAWEAVPLPPDAVPAAGSDRQLVVWQPSTDRLWEFWRLTKGEGSWVAAWGGAIDHVSRSSGIYGPGSWPGASRLWGASASSLSLLGGLITLEDLERGEINHALAIATPNVRRGTFAAPAQRTDGTSPSPAALPEGAHLQLDPHLDLAALRLSPLTLMLARAAQRYGIVVRDNSESVTSLFAQDPTPTGTNPYRGPAGFFEGVYPTDALMRFPWNHLQLLRMKLRSGQ